MYENAKSAVDINSSIGDPFPVKVGVHQGSVLSPLVFIIVLESLSMEFRTWLPWELLYADDLMLMADSIKELEFLFERWKSGMEQKGLRVKWKDESDDLEAHPACKCWVHAKCNDLKGQLAKATNFVCSQCSSDAVADRNNEEEVMLAGSNLEVVDKFYYLGDMLDAGGGTESSTVTRVRSGWKNFRELLPLLTTKANSELYAACVHGVMLYGSEKLKNLKGCTIMRCQ